MHRSVVTGGAGFIGSNMVKRLFDMGHEVVCIDNESSNSTDNFRWHEKSENHKVDICKEEQIAGLFDGADFVFHMAAESRIGPTIENPAKAMMTNVVGTANVLEQCRRSGVKRLVYSSTSAAYGSNPVPNVETQPDDCLNPYSVSKVAGEKVCTMYSRLFGLETVILRYFNVYGPGQPTKGIYAPVMGIFRRQKESGEPLTVVGDGTQRRDFTHVEDVVEANVKAALSQMPEQLIGTVFNVGSGTNRSVLEIARAISDKMTFVPERKGEMKETLADNSKVRTILGWEPKHEVMACLLNQA